MLLLHTVGPNLTHLCVDLVLRSFTFFVFRSFSFFLFFKNWTLRLPFRSNQLLTRNILFLLCYVKNHKSVKANPEFLQTYEVESSNNSWALNAVDCNCKVPHLNINGSSTEILCNSFKINIAWKVSKYGVISGPYFPVFELNTEIFGVNLRIQSEYRKIWTRNNSVLRHFSRSGTK